mmetsp:Transcript_21264/g.66721  ORF Transcript_21264/g.66721 Transcript_21264/m.66721 type:complete len:192 (-) Transcript_21264:270-845(-)
MGGKKSLRILVVGLALGTSGAFVPQPTSSTVLKLSEFKRTTGFGVRLDAETGSSSAASSSETLMAQAAALRAEVAEAEAAAPTPAPVEDAKAKITAALKRATQLRDKEQLRIALSAAEEAGFSGKDEVVRNAVLAYNELNELSDSMRQRLIAEARSQGGDPSVNWNPGFAYLGVFGLVAILVVLGGKDIFY